MNVKRCFGFVSITVIYVVGVSLMLWIGSIVLFYAVPFIAIMSFIFSVVLAAIGGKIYLRI